MLAPQTVQQKITTQPPRVILHHMAHYTAHRVPRVCTPQPPESFPKWYRITLGSPVPSRGPVVSDHSRVSSPSRWCTGIQSLQVIRSVQALQWYRITPEAPIPPTGQVVSDHSEVSSPFRWSSGIQSIHVLQSLQMVQWFQITPGSPVPPSGPVPPSLAVDSSHSKSSRSSRPYNELTLGRPASPSTPMASSHSRSSRSSRLADGLQSLQVVRVL